MLASRNAREGKGKAEEEGLRDLLLILIFRKGRIRGRRGDSFRRWCFLQSKAEAVRRTGVKLDIPIYDGQADPEKLNGLLKQLEVYLSTRKYTPHIIMQKISFARLKLAGHAWK